MDEPTYLKGEKPGESPRQHDGLNSSISRTSKVFYLYPVLNLVCVLVTAPPTVSYCVKLLKNDT